MESNPEEQDLAVPVLHDSFWRLCWVDVHDDTIGLGTQDVVWQGLGGYGHTLRGWMESRIGLRSTSGDSQSVHWSQSI